MDAVVRSEQLEESQLTFAKLALRQLKDISVALALLSSSCQETVRQLQKKARPAVFRTGVSSLPDELLVHIFNLAARRTDGLILRRAEIRISRVCSRFRQIALTTPALWCYLDNGSMPRSMLDVYLARSKNAGLNIRLQTSALGMDFHDFMEALLPHGHRWQRFEFYARVEDDDEMEAVNTALRERHQNLYLPSLIGFSIGFSSEDESRNIVDIPTDFYASWRMPNLRFLSAFNIIHPLWSPSKVAMSSITAFEFTHFRSDGDHDMRVLLVRLLQALSGLKHLSLDFTVWGMYSRAPSSAQLPKCILPNLESFDLRVNDGEELLRSLMPALNLPNVRSIALTIDAPSFTKPDIDSWMTLVFPAIFTYNSLTSFKVASLRPAKHLVYLSQLLNILPNLQHLTLEGVGFWSESNDGAQAVLRTLRLRRFCGFDLRDFERFKTTLQRRDSWDRFERLEVVNCLHLDKERLEQLFNGKEVLWLPETTYVIHIGMLFAMY